MLNQIDRYFITLNNSESPDTRSTRTVLVTSSNLLNRAGEADQPTREQPQEMEEIVAVSNQT